MIADTKRELEDIGGGRVRATLHPRPIAFRRGSDLRRIVQDWVAGDATYQHSLTEGLMCGVTDLGLRRIYPTQDLSRYVQVGAPYIQQAGGWARVPFSGATRQGHALTWSRPQADLRILHGGHQVKLEAELKGGYVPPNRRFAFPIDLAGLTRQGAYLLADGRRVLRMDAPVVYDAAPPPGVAGDYRPVAWEFAAHNGQQYVVMTLPDLSGMSRPVVDPTLTLDEGEAGIDVDSPLSGQSDQQGTNYGTATFIAIGSFGSSGTNPRYRNLLKFDLSSLSGATVTSATLTLVLYAAENTGGTTTYTVHRILSGNSGWTEGGACWDYAVGTTPWAGSEGCNTSGIDYSSTAMRSGTITTSAGAVDLTLGTAEFEAMIAANYGIILGGGGGSGVNQQYRFFRSSEYATASERPKLVVVYTSGGPVSAGARAALLGVGR